MDQRFFDDIRPIFGGKMTQAQVDGVSAIMNATDDLPADHRAYILATAFHETGQKMQPVTENLNYSVQGLLSTFSRARISASQADRVGRKSGQAANQQAIANTVYGGDWGRKNLGNTEAGDGWRYRGRGLVQITGRANYRKFGIEDTPEVANMLGAAVRILVDGMTKGMFTGRKLSDYGFMDFAKMRVIVNGNDRASDIAKYADRFYDAIRAYGDRKPDMPSAWDAANDPTPIPRTTPLGRVIVAALRSILGGGR
jgi:putative chitinase